MDTPHGIHFARDPNLPPSSSELSSLEPKKTRANSAKNATENEVSSGQKKVPDKFVGYEKGNPVMVEYQMEQKRQHEEAYPLVKEEDRSLITDALYITLEQMEVCKFVEYDRVGVYKGRELGFRGLACKHCEGQAGSGRYFPSSEASLSQTTTSITFINHIRRCRYVPKDIRDRLEAMPAALESPDNTDTKKNSKKSDKPLHGGRKVFFHRLWCRVHELEITETDEVEKAWEIKKASKASSKMEDGKDDDQDDYDPTIKTNLNNAFDGNIGKKRYRRTVNMTHHKKKEKKGRAFMIRGKSKRRIMRPSLPSRDSESESSNASSSEDEQNESCHSGSIQGINNEEEEEDDNMNEVSLADDDHSQDNDDESDGEMSADMAKMVETAAKWLTELDNNAGVTTSNYRPPKGRFLSSSERRGRGRGRPPNIDLVSNN